MSHLPIATFVVGALAATALLRTDERAAPKRDVPPVTRAEVEKLHRELIPAKTEPWETIGWRTDLLAAREEAEKAGKPLFLWAMNGHPLGCV